MSIGDCKVQNPVKTTDELLSHWEGVSPQPNSAGPSSALKHWTSCHELEDHKVTEHFLLTTFWIFCFGFFLFPLLCSELQAEDFMFIVEWTDKGKWWNWQGFLLTWLINFNGLFPWKTSNYNSLDWLTEFRETLTHVYQFIIKSSQKMLGTCQKHTDDNLNGLPLAKSGSTWISK